MEEDEYDRPKYRNSKSPATTNDLYRRQYSSPSEFNDNQYDDFDESTKYILDRARASRTKSFWKDEVEKARERSGMPKRNTEQPGRNQGYYDWNADAFVEPNQVEDNDNSSTLNDRTKILLNQVRQSTRALEDNLMESNSKPQQYEDFSSLRPSRFLDGNSSKRSMSPVRRSSRFRYCMP